jgi:membrane protease YdiL (CAAX protease family)
VIDATPAGPTRDATRDRRRLPAAGTILSGVVLALFAGWMTWISLTESRVDTASAPEAALALVVSRGMDLHGGLAQAGPWERRLHELVTTDGSDDLQQAIAWYEELAEELADHSVDPEVDAHLVILYGEAGEAGRVESMTAEWEARGGMLAMLAPIVSTAYLGTADTDEEAERAGLAEVLPAGWFRDRLALAWATRVGDAAVREQAQRALEARGRQLLWRARGLAVANLILVAVGIAALVAVWRRRGRREALAVGAAPIPPPWPMGVGLAVMVRGGAGAALVIVGLMLASGAAGRWLDLEHPVLDMLMWPLMYVPVLLLAHRHLLLPGGSSFREALGLSMVPGGARRLALVTLAAVAAGGLITTLLSLGGRGLQLTSHWGEWFDEDLAFGDTTAILANAVGSVVLAPVFEEAVFRGLLFASLRSALRPAPAIALSGAVFGVAHGYGVVGFLDVACSGMLWAWAFEMTRSILPGIAAHALTNLLVTATVLALLR